MKINNTITLWFVAMLLSLNINNVFCQSGIITYKAKPINLINKNSEFVRGINKEIELMSFVLKYNINNSFFTKEGTIPINKRNSGTASILIKSNVDWFQEAKNKKSLFNKRVKNNMYQVMHNFKMEGWKITGQTKQIDGYNCFKALRKEIKANSKAFVLVTAWFTPDIPLPYGPIGSGGLPGLILQLERSNRVVYTVDKILLNPKKINVKTPKQGMEVSTLAFNQIMRSARKVTVD